MDNDKALKRAVNGGTILVRGVPVGTEFGIDLHGWAVGPKFGGVKMIPPGLHFVYTASGSDESGRSPRTGFFVFLRKSQIVIRSWSIESEQLLSEAEAGLSSDEIERLEGAVRSFSFDANLGAYPADALETKWQHLTAFMSEDFCSHLLPVLSSSAPPLSESEGGEPPVASSSSSAPPSAPLSSASTSGDSSSSSSSSSPSSSSSSSSSSQLVALSFPSIDLRRPPPSSSALSVEAVTAHALDKSWLLTHRIETEYRGLSLWVVAELQAAFVAFLVGQSFEAWEQWKALVGLLTTSQVAVFTRPQVLKAFVVAFSHQLNEVSPELFEEVAAETNFLCRATQRLLERVLDPCVHPYFADQVSQSARVDGELVSLAKSLCTLVERKFGVVLSVCDPGSTMKGNLEAGFILEHDGGGGLSDEDAPVLVDLSEPLF